MNIDQLHDGRILRGDRVDATANRERVRRKRLWWAVVLLGAPLAYFWFRQLTGNPMRAIIHGVDDTWEVSLLRFTFEMIEKSQGINLFDFKRRGLLG